jgi:hypothetical protein
MNRLVIIVAAVAVAALTFAIRERVARRDSEATRVALIADRDRLFSELTALKQRLEGANERVVSAELQAASLKDDLSQLFSKKEPVAPVVGSGGRPQQGFAMGWTRRGGPLSLRSVPPVKALETTYHVLYRQLKLTPDQIQQFKAIMTEAAFRFEDVEREAKSKRVSVMDKSIQPLFAKADAELRASFTTLLGPEALPIVERFTETLFLRDTVAQFANELFYTDTPLTEPQANQLVEILAKNMRDPAGRLNTVFADASAMKADANDILSPPQRVVWGELIEFLSKTSFALLNQQRR